MAVVINRTTKQLIYSVNTPDYSDVDWIINPDLSSVIGISQKYWKIVVDSVLEMSTEEKAVVDAAEAASTLATGENYLTGEYNSSNHLVTETWYRDRTETGTYTIKVKEIVYTYEGNNIIQTVTSYFHLDGSVASTETMNYFSDLDVNKTYMEKTL